MNERPALLEEQLRRAFQFSAEESFTWLSPTADDEYAEYYDQAFIDRLGMPDLDVSLQDFWPLSGPRWDGLAKTASGKYILIEAKAYVEEAVDYRSSAGEPSMARISAALLSAKAAYRASEKGEWDRPFYQYANRLAHLYFLRGLNRQPAYLVFVCFANAPDVPEPCSSDMWIGAHRLMNKALGISKNVYSQFVTHVVIDVSDLTTPSGNNSQN